MGSEEGTRLINALVFGGLTREGAKTQKYGTLNITAKEFAENYKGNKGNLRNLSLPRPSVNFVSVTARILTFEPSSSQRMTVTVK